MIPDPTPNAGQLDTKAFVEAVKEGIASADAGRTVPYEEVRQWLLSWGTENELPKPECR